MRYAKTVLYRVLLLIVSILLFSTPFIYAQGFYDGSLPGTVVRVEIVNRDSGWPIKGARVTFEDKYGNNCGSMVTGEDGVVVFGVSMSARYPAKIEVRAKNYYSMEGIFPLERLKKHTANYWGQPLTEEEKAGFEFDYDPDEAYYINVETVTDSTEEYFEKVRKGEYNRYHSGNLLITIKIKLEKMPREIR